MTTDDRAKLEALPAFDDPHVQIVYRILCDTDLVPPPDEHWEGFTARHVVAALASAQAASAEPVARMPPLLNANDLSTNFCAKWSGAQKVEAGDILDWIMQQPLYAAPAPAVTDEMQSEFEPDEAGVQALRVAIEGECDGLDITDAQAREVLRYVGATIKCALTKTSMKGE